MLSPLLLYALPLPPVSQLSQWMTYSLMEPLQSAGFIIGDLGAMTGLPEYRNGGLLVDLGLLVPKYAEVITKSHAPDSQVRAMWRW